MLEARLTPPFGVGFPPRPPRRGPAGPQRGRAGHPGGAKRPGRHARLLRLAQVHASGRRVWALEGTGCYGAGLTRFLVDQGEWVVELDRPKRPRGRHGAKSDVLDAVRAGREALARDHLTSPRQRGHREALRVLHTTRAGIVQAGADARRQLKALIITAPEPLRDRLRGRPWRQRLRACAGLVAAPATRWSTGPPCGRWA